MRDKRRDFLRQFAPTPQNRELSWLSFNARVLQEAGDEATAAPDRLKFIGIVSSNLDEFYRVRIGSLSRLLDEAVVRGAKRRREVYELLDAVRGRAAAIHAELESAFERICAHLAAERNFHIVDHTALAKRDRDAARDYFERLVRPELGVVVAPGRETLSKMLVSDALYLSVAIHNGGRPKYALVEIPQNGARFVPLPGGGRYLWLDDLIRLFLPDIFATLGGGDNFSAYCFKATRNADFEWGDFGAGDAERMMRKIKTRASGRIVRALHDRQMPAPMLRHWLKLLKIAGGASVIAGGRYHGFRDFIRFAPPELAADGDGSSHSVIPPALAGVGRYFERVEKGDILLHFPYHSFRHLINLLREASLDASVRAIRMTIYRAARRSAIIGALINAVHNGKKVDVLLEVKARFDERANLEWQRRLLEAGANVLEGVANCKIHAKVCHIARAGRPDIAVFATGNFNENTARIYCDTALITADPKMTEDAGRVFAFLKKPVGQIKFNRILASPLGMRETLTRLIKNEIKAARAGKPASIRLKVNNLNDAEMLDLLDHAARGGVRLDLIVRGVFALDPDRAKYEGRVRAVSIIDSLLEHTRVFAFENRGDPLVFISSADWMARNLDHRVEVAAPVTDPALKAELLAMLDLQMRDNVKARILNAAQDNPMKRTPGPQIRSQRAFRKLLAAAPTRPA